MVKTKQRERILAAVRSSNSHPTADELFQTIRAEMPTISLATVYRNLGVLSEQGMIRKIEIPGGRDRFDWRLTDHEHFFCRKCGRIWDFALREPVSEMIPPEMGFTVQDYALVVRGWCKDCASGAAKLPANSSDHLKEDDTYADLKS